MASTYLELLIEPALEYQSSFQLRMNDFCRNHEVDESYYIKRELETWEKILIDIQNPEGTYDGYGHILSHDILDQIEKKIDYERLVIETEKKVTFINSLLKNDKTSQHDPGKHETLLKFFSALKNIQPRFYISEPDITKGLPQSTTGSPLRFFGYLLEARGFYKVKQLFWSPLEELELHMYVLNYDSESLVYERESQNPDGTIDCFQVDKKLEITNLLHDKISISKGLIDEKISSCQNKEEVIFFLNRILDELMLHDEKYRNHPLTRKHKFKTDIFTSFLLDIVKKYKSSIDDSKKEEIEAYTDSLTAPKNTNSENVPNASKPGPYHLSNYMSKEQWKQFKEWITTNTTGCNYNFEPNEETKEKFLIQLVMKILKQKGYYEKELDLKPKLVTNMLNSTFNLKKPVNITYVQKFSKKEPEANYSLPVFDPNKK